jgi:hypothetical protein
VFTARYALSPYIKQIRFVFKGLILYRDIITVCVEFHIKYINTLCGHNVEFLNVRHGSAHTKH